MRDAQAARSTGVFTVVNDDFAPGFICFERSLRKHNPDWDIPINVLYDKSRLPLSAKNRKLISDLCDSVHFIQVDTNAFDPIFDYARRVLQTPRRLLAAFYILDAFNHGQYDRVICLDSDMLVTGDLSPLLDVDEGFAAVEALENDSNMGRGFVNTGVMVVNSPWIGKLAPQNILEHCRGKAPRRGSGKADQALINMAVEFSQFDLLDIRFNFTKRIARNLIEPDSSSEDVRAVLTQNDVRILHYVGEKPWLLEAQAYDRGYAPLDDMWNEQVREIDDPRLDAMIVRTRRKWASKQKTRQRGWRARLSNGLKLLRNRRLLMQRLINKAT